MLPDRDIWTSANAMIKRYAESAAEEARRRACELKAEGDLAGQQEWLRILEAIEELRRTVRAPAEPLH
jgi:hypothetical protein